MISEVVMPQMGADMTEGTLLRWLKQEGDDVARGEVIAEIETDKANVEIEAFDGGVFRKVLAQEGDIVKVGEVIAVIAGADEDVSKYMNGASAIAKETDAQPAQASAPIKAPERPVSAAAAAATATTGAQPVRRPAGGRLRVSPLAKRIAEDRGIDLQRVRGTGPDGRIVKRDVEALGADAAASATTDAAGAQAAQLVAPDAKQAPRTASGVQPAMSKMRQAIARNMSQSKREAPHYYLLVDVDMTDAMAMRSQINETLGEDARVSVNDLLVRACALALQRHPAFNATMAGDAVTRHEAQNVCIAIALDDGLIAPALLDVGAKTLATIAAEAKNLVARAKNGALRAAEITDGTFTITNLGAYGVETLVGIIQPPQTAILGAGSVMPQPAVRDGAVAVRQIMKLALSADHRVTDGAQGAQFLAEIKRVLERPVTLVL